MAISKKVLPALSALVGTNALDVLFNQTHDALCVLGLDGRFLEVNLALIDKLGYSRTELLSMHFLSTVDRETRDHVAEEFANAVGGETVHLSVICLRKDGTTTHSELTTAPVFEAGVPVAIIALARDIDDPTIAQRERDSTAALLAKKEARFAAQEALLESSRDAIVVRGLDNLVQVWNGAAEDIYGWTAEEAIGLSIRELLYPDPTIFDAAMADLLIAGEWFGDSELVCRDGSTIIVEARWSLVYDVDGNPDSVLAVNSNVTQRRRQEEVVLRAQRMESLGNLAGGIAHDINNVLTPVLMLVQMLAADETDAAKQETLAVIESSAKRGADMMRQVLAFARGAEGRRVRVQCARLFADVEAFCREALPSTIRLRFDPPKNAWDVVGDPTQLLQVLVNLATNAKDAMPSGGELHVWARNVDVSSPFALRLPGPGHYLCIHVEDSGTGMPPDVVNKVFEPFFTTKGIGAGTGLGLATSISIVTSHGGSMQVQSKPGKGSRFDIYLAASASLDQATSETPDNDQNRRSGTGQLVLIVDDEPEIRLVARTALESFGYRTVVAGNGSEALSYLETTGGAVDLVFSDITMPVMDGTIMVGIIDEKYPALPVLLTSGLTVVVPNRANSTGRREFIAKPYAADELRAMVARALSTPEVQPLER